MSWKTKCIVILVSLQCILCIYPTVGHSHCEKDTTESCLEYDTAALETDTAKPLFGDNDVKNNEIGDERHRQSWFSSVCSYATDAFNDLTKSLIPRSPEPVINDSLEDDFSSEEFMKTATAMLNDYFDIDLSKQKLLAEKLKGTFKNEEGTVKVEAEDVYEYPPVVRLGPGKVGDVKYVELETGIKTKLITRAVRPPLFEIPEFISPEDCDYIVEKSREKGLNVSKMFQSKESTEAGENVGVFRESFSSFLKLNDIDEAFLHKLHDKVAALIGMPKQIVQWSENLAIGMYQPGGHYHAHLDSNEASRESPCCFQTNCTDSKGKDTENLECCRLCRYVTVLYYLRDVEEGGETAFPLADLSLQEMIAKGKDDSWQNLTSKCHDASVVIKPEKGKAIMWYNHFVDGKGYISAVDKRSYHGGCEVIKGTKWIATNWISTPIYQHRYKSSKYRDIV